MSAPAASPRAAASRSGRPAMTSSIASRPRGTPACCSQRRREAFAGGRADVGVEVGQAAETAAPMSQSADVRGDPVAERRGRRQGTQRAGDVDRGRLRRAERDHEPRPSAIRRWLRKVDWRSADTALLGMVVTTAGAGSGTLGPWLDWTTGAGGATAMSTGRAGVRVNAAIQGGTRDHPGEHADADEDGDPGEPNAGDESGAATGATAGAGAQGARNRADTRRYWRRPHRSASTRRRAVVPGARGARRVQASAFRLRSSSSPP